MISDLARRERSLLLGIVIVTLLAVTVLASGLSSVEVQSSRQFSLDSFQQAADLANLSVSSSAISAFAFLAGLIRVVLLVLLPFSIYYFVKSSNARKRTLIQVLYLAGFTYVILTLSKSLGRQPGELAPLPFPEDGSPLVAPETVGGATEIPGWVPIAASIAIAILLVLAAIFAYRRFLMSKRSERPVASDARRALDALDRGVELESVIFRAYHQLCVTSADRLGVRRHRDMTPTEYENILGRSGVPTSPLERLTRLFEKARYGSVALDENDEREAVSALKLILGEGS